MLSCRRWTDRGDPPRPRSQPEALLHPAVAAKLMQERGRGRAPGAGRAPDRAGAAVRQHERLRGTPAGAHVLVAATRYLAAHAPTVRAEGQTFRIARGRLKRGCGSDERLDE